MFELDRRLALALSAILGVLAFARGPEAAETKADVFVVADQAIDATAATATAAREQALATGERLAFERLLARLTLKRDARQLPKVASAALADLLEGFELQEEKNSPVRYIATVTYRFKPKGIERLLRDAGVGFAATSSKPVLVLPVLRTADGVDLWEDPNPWRAAWANLPAADGLVPFVVPLGDLKDIADVSADDAVKGDERKLAAIAARYDAGSVLVVVAREITEADGKPGSLDLSASRYGTGIDGRFEISSVPGQPGEAADELLARAARQIETVITERWKEDNLLRFDQAQEAVIAVPIRRLDDWLAVRRKLAEVALVSRAELVYLAQTEARVDVRYFGDPEQLKLALAQRDLILTEEGGTLVLRPARAGAGTTSE